MNWGFNWFRKPAPVRGGYVITAHHNSEMADSTKETLRQTLGQRIAIEAARDAIFRHTSHTGNAWWDTNRLNPLDVDTQFRVNQAVTFLDLCGLIQRMPGAPHIVQVKHGR